MYFVRFDDEGRGVIRREWLQIRLTHHFKMSVIVNGKVPPGERDLEGSR
jgi:hypothetical protein